MITIKRYANRKLYNTKTSTYTTLTEIRDMIRNGAELTVIDNATRQDITEMTVRTIVSELYVMKGKVPYSNLLSVIKTSEKDDV